VPSVDDQTAHKFREFVATHLRQAVRDIATAYDNVLQSEQAAFMLRAERIKATYADDVKRVRHDVRSVPTPTSRRATCVYRRETRSKRRLMSCGSTATMSCVALWRKQSTTPCSVCTASHG